MTIKYELTNLNNFEFWSGAKFTIEKIRECGKEEEAFDLLNEIFPEGCSETELNDFFWFDDEELFELLGIEND